MLLYGFKYVKNSPQVTWITELSELTSAHGTSIHDVGPSPLSTLVLSQVCKVFQGNMMTFGLRSGLSPTDLRL